MMAEKKVDRGQLTFFMALNISLPLHCGNPQSS